MSDYPSVTALMQRVVKEARNGVPPKAVAHILGMEYGTFMAQLGRRSNHKLDADLLLPLMEITDSYAPLHLLAEAMGDFCSDARCDASRAYGPETVHGICQEIR